MSVFEFRVSSFEFRVQSLALRPRGMSVKVRDMNEHDWVNHLYAGAKENLALLAASPEVFTPTNHKVGLFYTYPESNKHTTLR